MTDQVNGNARAGEFLTGDMNFFSVATIVPVAQTNVRTPVVDLPGYQTFATLGTWTNVTVVNGAGSAVTYSTLNSYLDAFYKQANMDILLRSFAQRGNPVVVSAKVLPTSINGGTINANTSAYFGQAGYANADGTNGGDNFGSDYTTGNVITIVGIATEKADLWTAGASETNASGYSLLAALDGVSCFDTQSSQVLSGSATSATNPYAVKNTTAPYVNTFETGGAAVCNTIIAQGSSMAGTLLV